MGLWTKIRTRLERFPVLGLLPLWGVQWVLSPQGYVGQDHDDALYFLAAQSLRTGGYHQWFLPGAPPITNLTPGLPAFLAPFSFLGPDNPVFAQWACVLALMGATALAGQFFRRHFPTGTAWGLTALFALNPLVLSRAGMVMPEPLFAAVLLAAVLGWERNAPWVTGALLAALYLIRPAALPVWAAAGTVLVWQRTPKKLLPVLLPAVLTYAAWALWSQPRGGVAESLELSVLYGGKNIATAGTVAGHNLLRWTELWGATLLPLPWANGPGARVLGAALWAVAAVGLWVSRRDPGARFPGLILLASAGMHAVWPWWYDRYLLPLLPFQLFFAARGWSAAPGPWGRRATVLIGVLGGAALIGQGPALARRENAAPPGQDMYAWIQTHTVPEDRLASLFYARDLLYTGRSFGPLPEGDTAPAFATALDRARIRYVLWETLPDLGFSQTDNPVTAGLSQRQLFLQDAAHFQRVHTDPSGQRILYQRTKE